MTMTERGTTKSARIREQLDHPVIDADGHVLELLPVFADFVRNHGRGDLVEAAPVFKMGPAFWQTRRETSFEDRRSKGLMANNEEQLFRAGTPQDVTSLRAKSQRHGKVTADRWNQ